MPFKFESPEFKNTFEQVIGLASNRSDRDLELPENIIKIASVLDRIERFFPRSSNLSQFDEKITYSTKQDGFNFVERIGEDLREYNKEKNLNNYINVICRASALIYIYLREFEFKVGGFHPTIGIEIGDFFIVVGSTLKLIENFSRFIDFGDRDLVFNILKEIFFSNEIRNLNELIIFKNDLTNQLKEMDSRIQQYEVAFEQKKEAIIELEQKLDKYKITYDFVLLNKGFQQLYEQKKIELKNRQDGYSLFGALLVCTPFAVIIAIVVMIISGYEAKITSLWFFAIPITTLMIFLFYFTRVGLQNVRSTQSQMMQLELRMALCQFIHNYAEDSEKLHKKNAAGFEKFENIIFSPLVSSDDKIPTTFDGMEQLAKLVSEFRKN